jgi:hypothetical protein
LKGYDQLIEKSFDVIKSWLWPRSFLGLKSRFASTFVFALVIQIGLQIKFASHSGSPNFDVVIEGPSLHIVITVAIMLGFFATLDWGIWRRQQQLQQQLITLLANPSVPERLKIAIVRQLANQPIQKKLS